MQFRTPLHLALSIAFEDGETGVAVTLLKAKADPSLGNKEWGMENTAVHEVRARLPALAARLPV